MLTRSAATRFSEDAPLHGFEGHHDKVVLIATHGSRPLCFQQPDDPTRKSTGSYLLTDNVFRRAEELVGNRAADNANSCTRLFFTFFKKRPSSSSRLSIVK